MPQGSFLFNERGVAPCERDVDVARRDSIFFSSEIRLHHFEIFSGVS